MIKSFQKRGLENPARMKALIARAIGEQRLNLRGMVVLTEAASNNFVVTPVIAAAAGAQVYAVAQDSPWGKAKDIARLTYDFAKFCQIKKSLQVIFKKKKEIIEKADIITNLGFVRPIDKTFIGMMKKDAVISLMCEAWEYRKSDVDLKACKAKGITVVQTDESAPGLRVFDYAGPLCAKMLFEAQVEIYQSKIVIVSADKFGTTIHKYLKLMGARSFLLKNLESAQNQRFLKDADAVVIADYKSTDVFLGKLPPQIRVIQFASNFRMGRTFADLGPKPVIDLHCAGLKAGEITLRARKC